MHLLRILNAKVPRCRLISSASGSRAVDRPRTFLYHRHTLPFACQASAGVAPAPISINANRVSFSPGDNFRHSSSTSSWIDIFNTTPQREQVFRDVFLSFATQDGDTEEPHLRVEDLRDLLLALGHCPSESKLEILMETVDADGNGIIEYQEFLAGCETILRYTQEEAAFDIDSIIDLFRTLDADGSGDLTVDELSGLLSTAGVPLNEDEVQDIMQAADSNGDGKISLEEFLTFMLDDCHRKFSWRVRSGFRVCLVMGGPGSGKGTLCDKLVEHANLRHYSSGEMLREEIASGSALAKSIEKTMLEGKLVASSTIIALLKKQLRQFPGSLVALDGFPRNKQNYLDFDNIMGSPEFAIAVDVPDEEMINRIMKRAVTSGRADDNIETAHRRLKTFHDATTPTMGELETSGVPIYRLDGTKSPDEVWNELLDKCPPIGTRVMT